MPFELFFTSAPAGLLPGRSGFCTVAATRGLPAPLLERLEALSIYKHLYAPLDPRNPVSYSHARLRLGAKVYHVLARIGAAPLDHTGRSNYLAHHVVLTPDELPTAGPAWLLAQPGVLSATWDGQVGQLPPRGRLPQGNIAAARCRAWQEATGDAGWAGVLLESFCKDGQKPAHLLHPAGLDPLALFAEALALLPPSQRWEVTFNTYARGSLQAGSHCWRALPLETPEAEGLERQDAGLVLNLGNRLGRAAESPFTDAARKGMALPERALSLPEGTSLTAVQQQEVPVETRPASSSRGRSPRATAEPADSPFPQPEAAHGQTLLFAGIAFVLGVLLMGLVATAGFVMVIMPRGQDQQHRLEEAQQQLEKSLAQEAATRQTLEKTRQDLQQRAKDLTAAAKNLSDATAQREQLTKQLEREKQQAEDRVQQDRASGERRLQAELDKQQREQQRRLLQRPTVVPTPGLLLREVADPTSLVKTTLLMPEHPLRGDIELSLCQPGGSTWLGLEPLPEDAGVQRWRIRDEAGTSLASLQLDKSGLVFVWDNRELILKRPRDEQAIRNSLLEIRCPSWKGEVVWLALRQPVPIRKPDLPAQKTGNTTRIVYQLDWGNQGRPGVPLFLGDASVRLESGDVRLQAPPNQQARRLENKEEQGVLALELSAQLRDANKGTEDYLILTSTWPDKTEPQLTAAEVYFVVNGQRVPVARLKALKESP